MLIDYIESDYSSMYIGNK